MKCSYDKANDILYIRLSEGEIVESKEDQSGVIIDNDKEGNIVGVEVLHASGRINKLDSLELEML